jgi:hypothetical protein
MLCMTDVGYNLRFESMTASSISASERQAQTSWRAHFARMLERNGTLVLLLCGGALIMLVRLPTGVAQDGWMALVSGREIVQHGLPSHDTLTVWAHGRSWTDQQWLGQLALYAIDRLGGIRLLMLLNAGLNIGTFAVAAAVARRTASALSVTWIGVLALAAYMPDAIVMRTQSFAYPLFVVVVALLLADARRPSHRVYLCLPALVLWANLHGSVLVGAVLVSAYALWRLAGRREERGSAARPLLLLAGAWLGVFASPYGLSLASYYEHFAISGHLGRYAAEWAPTTLTLLNAPAYLLVFGGAWLLGRGKARTFEIVAFAAIALLAFTAVRNLVWLGLLALIVLPALLDAARTQVPAPPPRRLNAVLGGTAIVVAALALLVTATRNGDWLVRKYPTAAADAASTAAGKTGRVFANEAYADWLIWSHPSLAGRVAFDSRFELLTDSEMASVVDFHAAAGDWRATAVGYRVLVLSTTHDAPASLLAHDRHTRIAARGDGIVVLQRSAAGSR